MEDVVMTIRIGRGMTVAHTPFVRGIDCGGRWHPLINGYCAQSTLDGALVVAWHADELPAFAARAFSNMPGSAAERADAERRWTAILGWLRSGTRNAETEEMSAGRDWRDPVEVELLEDWLERMSALSGKRMKMENPRWWYSGRLKSMIYCPAPAGIAV